MWSIPCKHMHPKWNQSCKKWSPLGKLFELQNECQEPLASRALIAWLHQIICPEESVVWFFHLAFWALHTHQKISMSHQNISHHLISNVSSVDIEGLIMLNPPKEMPPRVMSWLWQSRGLSSKWPCWWEDLTSNSCLLVVLSDKLHFNNFEGLFGSERWV